MNSRSLTFGWIDPCHKVRLNLETKSQHPPTTHSVSHPGGFSHGTEVSSFWMSYCLFSTITLDFHEQWAITLNEWWKLCVLPWWLTEEPADVLPAAADQQGMDRECDLRRVYRGISHCHTSLITSVRPCCNCWEQIRAWCWCCYMSFVPANTEQIILSIILECKHCK